MVVLQPIKPGPPRVNLSLKRGRARRALSLLGNNNSQRNLQLAESLLTISAEEFTNKWNFDPIQGVPLPSGRFQWTPITTPMMTSSTSNDLPAESVTPPVEDTKAVMMTTPCDLTSSSGGDLPNPAEDKSKEQKTCITLPPPSATASPCQVTESQPSDLVAKKATTEAETGTAVSDSHDCCPRTCACDNNMALKDHTNGAKDLKKPADRVKAEADSGIDSDDSVLDEHESSTSPTTTSGQNDDCDSSTKLRQTCITEFVRPKKLSSSSAFKVPESSSRSSNYSKKRPASSLQDQLSQPPHKKVLLHLRA